MRMTIPSLLQGKSLGLQAWSYAVLVTIIPALLWLLLIQRFGLPVLYADDWGFMPFILKLREGSLHFADYWAPHGPHPLIVTRAFFALFFRSGPLDPRPIMFCSWLLATGAAIVANRYLIWPRVSKHPASLKVLAGLAFSVWALSLVQFESQLWGIEIAFIATLCCALLGASVLAIERCRLSIRVAALLLVGGAGALTSGQGVMLLPALAVGCLFCAAAGGRPHWWPAYSSSGSPSPCGFIITTISTLRAGTRYLDGSLSGHDSRWPVCWGRSAVRLPIYGAPTEWMRPRARASLFCSFLPVCSSLRSSAGTF